MVNDTLTSLPSQLANDITFLITLAEALGGIILIYLIFGVINLILNRKKNKEIQMINKNLEEIKGLLKQKKS